ncbi:MAG: hypothetical protein ABIW81_03900 [Terrimesophilobacter sp.]
MGVDRTHGCAARRRGEHASSVLRRDAGYVAEQIVKKQQLGKLEVVRPA